MGVHMQCGCFRRIVLQFLKSTFEQYGKVCAIRWNAAKTAPTVQMDSVSSAVRAMVALWNKVLRPGTARCRHLPPAGCLTGQPPPPPSLAVLKSFVNKDCILTLASVELQITPVKFQV